MTTRLGTRESITVLLSPFAPRKPRSFAERKATVVSAPVLARIFLAAAFLWIIAGQLLLAAGNDKKVPVPSKAEQAAAMKLVMEIYQAEFANAHSPAAKQALAKKLLAQAVSTHDDMPGRYVLLKLAREMATDGLDGLTAFQAIETMSDTFEIDPIEMKAAVLKEGAAHATVVEHHKCLMEVALSLVDAAIAEDNYSIAKQLCDLAASEATAANDTKNRDLATRRGLEVETVLAALYEKAQTAAAMLNTDPVNPQANTASGKYLCFDKGEWDRGVLMLALGNDAGLKAAAQMELDELSRVPPVQVGDSWWDYAEKENGTIKNQTRARAAVWYRKALPGLSGLMKARVEKRLSSLSEQPAPKADSSTEYQPSSPKYQSSSPKHDASLSEHTSWTVPYTWSEQVVRYKPAIEYSPQSGHSQGMVPYTATVHHHGTKTVQASLVSYDSKTGNVVLKIKEDRTRNEVERSFRYAALGDDDKKYLDSVRTQQTGQ